MTREENSIRDHKTPKLVVRDLEPTANPKGGSESIDVRVYASLLTPNGNSGGSSMHLDSFSSFRTFAPS